MRKRTPRNPRFAVDHPVMVESSAGFSDGLIVDLHADGAAVTAEPAFAIGEEVTLEVNGHEICAQVMWQRDNKMGLSFTKHIPDNIVSQVHAGGDGWVIY